MGPEYSPADIERGLQALALLGNAEKAAEQTGIPRTTLGWWQRDKHAERYAQIRETVVPAIHAAMAAETEDLARRYAETEATLLEKFNRDLHDLPAKDQAGAIRNLATSRAISTDKALLMRGRPTAITEHRDPEAILRKLESLGIVDTTATEAPALTELSSPTQAGAA